MKSRLRPGPKGFTFVELVIVLVIGGILAAVILPKLGAGTVFDERSFRDRVLAGLRYAQKSAIASRRTVCATFSAAPVQVSFLRSVGNGAADCAGGPALIGPDGTPLVVSATGNVTFAALPADVVFDAGGRPTAGAAINVYGLPAAMVITVEAETGYVH